MPANPARCEDLEVAIRKPGALPLDEYERLLGEFLRNFCHRNPKTGWQRDKSVRDTGPYTATLKNGEWVGEYHGTHAPVVIWYSREMVEWLHQNRPIDARGNEAASTPETPPPIPDGAVMVKEMYPAPAAACAGVDPLRLLPTSGAAVMVRDREASHDGWYWGWFGWSGWDPDWPTGPHNRLPYQGFGQYCVNCHASARDNLTFASLRNVEGEPGRPLVFLSQDFFSAPPAPDHHRLVALPSDDAPRLGQPLVAYNPDFLRWLGVKTIDPPTWESVARMPSETYDNVWVQATADGVPTAASQFVTSDQCIGCHDAGGTGLQLDMTAPNPHANGDSAELLNLSPYATWKTSPMGMGGRDPIFFAQLASETQTFHPQAPEAIDNVCLGCHGIGGQRQYGIDTFERGGACEPFTRAIVNAVPYPPHNPSAPLEAYGALARDGISCSACHHMLVGEGDSEEFGDAPQNRCVEERQKFLNPHNEGFAKTFTGSFLVNAPDKLYGPFKEPKTKPMDHSLGILPEENTAIQASELCGSCHTVHLPIFDGSKKGRILGYTYEQTTYPEWAFSAYRTGETPQGGLPEGAGERAQSCQACHMPSKDADGKPTRSKIAGIQEYSNYPQAEYNLPPEDLDLEVREGYARHTLVGLNAFFVKMAQQFPDILGMRTQDPMLGKKGLDPLLLTEQKMLDQAGHSTVRIEIASVTRDERTGTLRTKVALESDTGHKFPSGVGFRRAFIEFQVLDQNQNTLWASGRANTVGLLVDEQGDPLPGELWWKDDCSGYLDPREPVYQPHYQEITRQDQVQIYQELVTAPPKRVAKPECGEHPTPGGQLTTSFLSICGKVKDNRILPAGFLPLDERVDIAEALGAGEDLAKDSGAYAVGDDPDYQSGGGDSLVYDVPLAELGGEAASVKATLYYQATPPYFLQDRFCTARGADTERLFFLGGHLNLESTAAAGWSFEVVDSGSLEVPAEPTAP